MTSVRKRKARKKPSVFSVQRSKRMKRKIKKKGKSHSEGKELLKKKRLVVILSLAWYVCAHFYSPRVTWTTPSSNEMYVMKS